MVPPGQNLPELRLSDGQQYFYAEVPGLGGKGTARSDTTSCHPTRSRIIARGRTIACGSNDFDLTRPFLPSV